MSDSTAAIFRGLTREELDGHYNNRLKVPEFEDYVARWRDSTEAARRHWSVNLNVQYGDASVDTLDVYRPVDAGSDRLPCHVFFHGGYWFSMSKDNFGYVANGLCPHDWCTVVVDYELIPTTTMAGLIDQCRRALAYVHTHAEQLNIDPARIQISGHSAGGHIVGMMLATDWPSIDQSLVATPFQSACSLSGLFDLEAIRLSYLNDTLGLTQAESAGFSPVRLPCMSPTPLSLLVGGLEGSEYERQSRDLQDAWGSVLPDDGYQVIPGLEHFSIVDALDNPGSEIVERLLDRR